MDFNDLPTPSIYCDGVRAYLENKQITDCPTNLSLEWRRVWTTGFVDASNDERYIKERLRRTSS